MKVVFSSASRADIASIGQYIAQENAAARFTEELIAACEIVSLQPLGSPLASIEASADLRRKVHGRHLIFYRVDNDRIEIVRVLHGSRDIERVLRSGEP